jgi:hypothetical protein
MFDTMTASLGNFKALTKGPGGSAGGITSKQGLVDFNNKLTDYVGNLLQEQNKAFANVQFQSLGGQSLAQMFPGKGGKGLGRQANFLTNSLLAPAGFFSADTAEGRQAAVKQAMENVGPALQKVGLSGKELEQATKQLRTVLEAVSQAYNPVVRSAAQLNKAQFEAARARARTAVQEGRFADADREISNLTPYVTTRVARSRRRKFTSEADVTATSEADLSPQARTNLKQNADVIQGDIARARNRLDGDSLFTRLGKFAGRALSIFGGLQFAIGGTAAALGGLVEQANALDRAAATVNALSGSFEGFTQVLTLGVTQQQKFGGTLEQTLQGFNSLIPISKRYGADLLQLDNIARRLAVIDPIQGFQGASIALKEFFSGDITSLSRRFEIDRKTLNSIKDAGDKLEQLQKLDEVLAELGISNAVLESRTQTTAATYDRFGAVLSNTTTFIGKAIQRGYKPLVQNLTEVIDYTEELSVGLANEQLYINLATNIERVTRQLIKLGEAANNVVVENPLERFTGEFVDLNKITSKNRKTMEELVDEANELVRQLNEVRAGQGLPTIQLFSDDDYELIKELVELSNKTGISVINLVENRGRGGAGFASVGQTVNRARANVDIGDRLGALLGLGYQTEDTARYYDALKLVGNPSSMDGSRLTALLPEQILMRLFSNLTGSSLLGGETLFGSVGFDPSQYFRRDVLAARELSSQRGLMPGMDTDALRVNFLQAGLPFVEALRAQTQALKLLTPRYREQVALLEEQTGINYVGTMLQYQVALQQGNLTQDQVNKILVDIIALNKKLMDATKNRIQYESDYVTQNLATVSSFGGQALNEKLVQQVNQITQKNAETTQRILAQAYTSMGGGASGEGMSDELRKLVQAAEQYFGLTREQLYYQGQLEKRQALITLEANKSVSAFAALRGQLSGMQVPLQEAVRLAVEFNDSIQGMASNMVGRLSLDEQMRYYTDQFNDPRAMINQGAITGNIEARLGILYQQADKATKAIEELPDLVAEAEEAKMDLLKDHQDGIADLVKDHEEKKRDLLEDYEKDKLKLLKDYEEKKLKLLIASEVSKRESKAGFYGNLLLGGMNLTPEQELQASTEYEAFFEEASQLRNQGEFQKADAVLAAGTESIQNRLKMQSDIANEEESIKDSQEELIDLRKKLGKTADKEDREEIERRIALVQQDILDSQERIDRIKAVYTKTKLADDERVLQARNSEEQITEDYEDALDDRATAYKEALDNELTQFNKSLADKEEAYNKSLAKIEENLEKSLKKQAKKTEENAAEEILSYNDIVQWKLAGYATLEAARVAAEGGSQEQIQNVLTNRLRPIKEYFKMRGTPAAQILLEGIEEMEQPRPSFEQARNPAVTATLSGGMSPFAEELIKAGVLPQGTTEPGITPFQASVLDNTAKISSNTTAVDLNTRAVDTLARAIQTTGLFRSPFGP